MVAGRDGMKRTEDDARAVLTRSQATREKTARLLKKAGARSQAPEGSVDLAAVRASVRRAVVEDEVEKRVAARAGSDRPLSEKKVCEFVGRSRATLRRWVQHEGFPKPRPIAPNSVAWSEREVKEWWEKKKALRGGEGE